MSDALKKKDEPAALAVKTALAEQIDAFRLRQMNLAVRTLDITEEAQRDAHEMLGILRTIAVDERKNSHARIKAANSILDRALGKAPSGGMETLPDPSTLSDGALMQQVYALMREKMAGGGMSLDSLPEEDEDDE